MKTQNILIFCRNCKEIGKINIHLDGMFCTIHCLVCGKEDIHKSDKIEKTTLEEHDKKTGKSAINC